MNYPNTSTGDGAKKFVGQGPLDNVPLMKLAPQVIDDAYLTKQRNWSRETFGPAPRLNGVLDHITKELQEIREAPHDPEEWADLLILAFDGALRAGIYPQEIIDAVHAKFEKNTQRAWPDWKAMPDDVAIEHIRDVEHVPEQQGLF